MTGYGILFFFQAEDGIRDAPEWLEFRRVLFRSDFYRQEKNARNISNDECDYDLFNNKDFSERTIEENIVESQVMSDIRKLVENLPDNQREVIVMRYYKDMSFKEIADATNVSINTALGRMRYAVLNMRKMAEKYDICLTL